MLYAIKDAVKSELDQMQKLGKLYQSTNLPRWFHPLLLLDKKNMFLLGPKRSK